MRVEETYLTSFEISKKLKEAGFLKEGASYWWYPKNDAMEFGLYRNTEILPPFLTCCYAAYTSDDILECLPGTISITSEKEDLPGVMGNFELVINKQNYLYIWTIGGLELKIDTTIKLK